MSLQTHIQNMYLLLFHGNNGYVNAPQFEVIRTIHCDSMIGSSAFFSHDCKFVADRMSPQQ